SPCPSECCSSWEKHESYSIVEQIRDAETVDPAASLPSGRGCALRDKGRVQEGQEAGDELVTRSLHELFRVAVAEATEDAGTQHGAPVGISLELGRGKPLSDAAGRPR